MMEAPPSNERQHNVDYTVTLFVRGDATIEARSELWLTVVSEEDAEERSPSFNISNFKPSQYARDKPNLSGTNFTGQLSLPSSFKPGVVLLELKAQDSEHLPAPLFLRKLTLEGPGRGQSHEYVAQTTIDRSQGERIIFPSYSCIPSATPPGIVAYREKALQAHQGNPASANKMRSGADLIYDFDVYNDLGKPEAKQERPTLGGNPDFPFPRRIRTNRGLDEKGFEKRIPDTAGKLPWVPIDERFTLTKERTYQGLTNNCLGALGGSTVGFVKALTEAASVQQHLATSEFKSLAEVDAMYDGLAKSDASGPMPALRKTSNFDLLHALSKEMHRAGDRLAHFAEKLLIKMEKDKAAKSGKAPAREDPAVTAGELSPEEMEVLKKVQGLNGVIHRWPVPNVRKGRKDLWHTDEDFGRQVMEGQNPLVIRAMTQQDLDTFATTEKDVEGLLEGASLAARVAEGGRMFVLDFHTHFVDYLDEVDKLEKLPTPIGREGKRVLYAARCILFSRDDKALVPVAIELETAGLPLTVYTPNTDAQLWRLAKVVVNSLEAWHHQAVVHLLQTHLVVEPYIIATRRELSAMHPVFKLLQPVFRWTMRPNADARQNLISAQGVLENAFTPGKFSMQIISRIYADTWRFDTQEFAADLLSRGVAKEGPDGLEITLPGYSYAQDGLLIHNALKAWVASYTAIYYNDALPGKRVQDDAELLAWWAAVQEGGHPDKPEGWPELQTVADLNRILLTIMWTCGPHHAAVNYGQYQSSGYMPNRPTMLRRQVPLPGSPEHAAMKENFEGFMMSMMSDQASTAIIMLMTKLLSHHSADEEFINDSCHSWIRDASALEAHTAFVEQLNAAEAEMAKRNQSQERLRSGKGMPYTQMMPGVDVSELPEGAFGDPGFQVTYRGIPNSVAI